MQQFCCKKCKNQKLIKTFFIKKYANRKVGTSSREPKS